MNPFQLSRNTTLLSDAVTEKAVELACERLRRDMEKTLTDIVKNRNRIILCKKDLKPEQYELEVTEQEITIYGADARSFIYALNYLSETYLGVLPFWFWNDQKIELTRNEFRILKTLMENRGKIVSRDTLMTRLWEDDCYVEENTLTVNVTRLRKKLEQAGLKDFITTRVGHGYLIELPEEHE